MKCSMLKLASCPTMSGPILQYACQQCFSGDFDPQSFVQWKKYLWCTAQIVAALRMASFYFVLWNSTPQVCDSIWPPSLATLGESCAVNRSLATCSAFWIIKKASWQYCIYYIVKWCGLTTVEDFVFCQLDRDIIGGSRFQPTMNPQELGEGWKRLIVSGLYSSLWVFPLPPSRRCREILFRGGRRSSEHAN